MPHTPLADSLAAMEIVAAPPAADALASTQWRYLKSAHPVTHPVTLGEGGTPLLTLRNGLLLKDEGRNPNGSVQDRVASILLTAARAAGCMHIALPGNSSTPDSVADALAVSVAVYAAQAGLRANIPLSEAASEADFLRVAAAGAANPDTNPDASPNANQRQAEIISASDRAQATRLAVRALACELAEQMRWKLPETVLLPGASPVELLEYEASFAWLRERGWVTSPHAPRCVAVHITAAMDARMDARNGAPARIAAQALQKMSEAVAIVEEEHVRTALAAWAQRGWMLSPGAAAALAYCEQHRPEPGTTVVVNPRSALACANEIARLLRIRRYPGRMPVGGIITPQ